MKLNSAFIGLAVVVFLSMLSLYYSMDHENHRLYPGRSAVISGFEGVVVVSGVVTGFDEEGFSVFIQDEGESMDLLVLSDEVVGFGDSVEVLGVMDDGVLFPESLLMYSRWSFLAVYLRSALAFPFVLFYFFSYWFFDFDSLVFVSSGWGVPDWLAHVLFAYVLCWVVSFSFNVWGNANTGVVLVGVLLPDVVKVNLGFQLVGLDVWDFIAVLHTPVGTLLLAALLSLFFNKPGEVFPLFLFGSATHFFLDFLLMRLGGGLLFFFPFSWTGYQLGLMPVDNYSIALMLVFISVMISKNPLRKGYNLIRQILVSM